MLNRAEGTHAPGYVARRRVFCANAGIDYDDTVYQRIVYSDDQTYDKIVVVGGNDTVRYVADVSADALITIQEGVALFLPVADCAVTVFHDPIEHILAIAHLGRHSTYAKLAGKMIEQLKCHGSSAADLIVWMSPHAQKQSYKVEWFDREDDPDWQGYYEKKADGVYLDMAGFNRQLMERQGVRAQNIHSSPVDTVTDGNYFSHSAGDTTGRIAVIALMK